MQTVTDLLWRDGFESIADCRGEFREVVQGIGVFRELGESDFSRGVGRLLLPCCRQAEKPVGRNGMGAADLRKQFDARRRSAALIPRPLWLGHIKLPRHFRLRCRAAQLPKSIREFAHNNLAITFLLYPLDFAITDVIYFAPLRRNGNCEL